MSTLRDMDNTLTDPVCSVRVKIRAKFMHEKTEIFEPTAFYNDMNTMHWTYLPALFIRFLPDVFGKRNPCCSESPTRYEIEFMLDYDEEYVKSDQVGDYVWKELLKESPPLNEEVEKGIFYPRLWRGHVKKHRACFLCGADNMGPPDGYLTCIYCRCDYIILEEAIHKEDQWVCVGQNEYFSELLPTITHRDIRLERTGDAIDFTRCALILVGPTRLPHCSPASTQVTVRDNGDRIRKCYVRTVPHDIFFTQRFTSCASRARSHPCKLPPSLYVCMLKRIATCSEFSRIMSTPVPEIIDRDIREMRSLTALTEENMKIAAEAEYRRLTFHFVRREDDSADAPHCVIL